MASRKDQALTSRHAKILAGLVQLLEQKCRRSGFRPFYWLDVQTILKHKGRMLRMEVYNRMSKDLGILKKILKLASRLSDESRIIRFPLQILTETAVSKAS